MKDPKPPTYRPPDAWKLAGKGVELAAGVLVFTLLGYWVDLKYESISPWGMVTGAILGIIGGLYNLVRQSVHETFGRSSPGSRRQTGVGHETRQAEKPSHDREEHERSEDGPETKP